MTDFETICQRLAAAESILCITHRKPDGDGLGSMAALLAGAREKGKAARALLHEPLPPRYAFLFSEPPDVGAEAFDTLAAEADLVVLLDTCSRSQLDSLAGPVEAARDKLIVIDHHATSDDIGSARWLDATAASTGLMTLELLEQLDWPIAPAEAEALAVAILTDTGWLRFSNADGRCLRGVARLVDAGVAIDTLYARLNQSDRLHRLRLLERLLHSLELHCGEKLAMMSLARTDFEETGARLDETENLINEAMRLASVEVAALLVENETEIRASLRSRAEVNVADVAAQFGGGGHARAAGLRLEGNLEEAKAQLLDACQAAIDA